MDKNSKTRSILIIVAKYAIRAFFGLLALFWALLVYVSLTPAMEEYPCEGDPKEDSITPLVIMVVIHILFFCVAWYATRNMSGKKDYLDKG